MNVQSATLRRAYVYLGVLMMTLAFLLAMLGYFLWVSHRQAIQTAEVATRNLALALEARLQGNLARVDAALGLLAHEATPAMMQKSAVAAWHQNLTAHMAQIVGILHFPVYTFGEEGPVRPELVEGREPAPFSLQQVALRQAQGER